MEKEERLTYGELAEECFCILNRIFNDLRNTALESTENFIEIYKNKFVKNYGENNVYKAVRLAFELKTEILLLYNENRYDNLDLSSIFYRIDKINKLKAELDKEIELC